MTKTTSPSPASEIVDLLADITECTERDDGTVRTAIEVDANDDEAADGELAEIRALLPTGWAARWTGNGNGMESEVAIEPTPTSDAEHAPECEFMYGQPGGCCHCFEKAVQP